MAPGSLAPALVGEELSQVIWILRKAGGINHLPPGFAGGAGNLILGNLIRFASALCPVTQRHNEIFKMQ